MPNLEIIPRWNAEISEIAFGDLAAGGPIGNVNIAPKQLAENIFWLKHSTNTANQTLERKITDDVGAAISAAATATADLARSSGASDAVLQVQINSIGGGNVPYLTYAKMVEAKADITNKMILEVTNDTDPLKNGRYTYDGVSVFAKSNYDVLALAKADTTLKIADAEKKIFGADAIPKPVSFTLIDGYIDNAGRTSSGLGAPSGGYKYTSVILLNKGLTISFDYYGAGLSALVLTNANFTTATPIILMDNQSEGTKRRATYTATEDTYVVASSRTTLGAMNLVVEIAEIKPIADALISKQAIAYDINEPSDLDKVSSLVLSKSISDELSKLSEYIAPLVSIDAPFQSGFFQWDVAYAITDQTIAGVELTLKKGDILTFDYTPIDGTTLWDYRGGVNVGWPLLTEIVNSSTVKSHKFVAYSNMTVRITNSVANTVRVNNVIATTTNLGAWGYVQYPTLGGITTFTRSGTFDVKKGDTVYITKGAKGALNIVQAFNFNVGFKSIVGQTELQTGDAPVTWVAPSDMTIAVCGIVGSEFFIRRSGVSLDSRFSNNTADDLPSSIKLPPKEFVFATAMNYILKTEVISGVDYIKISEDLGKTWTQMPNILGDIVSYHFFSDGTIMLCSPTKVYWTDDYLTLNESTVYDHDGSVFVPTSRHFFAMQTGDKLDFVGDQEIFAWGDYHIGNVGARIWYSIDNGRTIKCAAKFGTTSMGGTVRAIRHVHRVYYHAKTNYFYVTTGDNGNENMIIRARYDVITDAWDWNILNAGIEYKFGNIMIDDNNMAYMITDYTDVSLAEKKGVYRVHASHLNDITKYRMIYKAKSSEWGQVAPVSLLLDNNSNKVLLPDYLGAGFIWLARQGLDFKRVRVSPNVLLSYCIGENYNGDIWCVAYEGGNILRLNSGSYNLTKALRGAGISNFMRGTKIVSGLSTVLS